MSRLRKEFPGVVALRSASIELQPGEIHALVGANGAGKSTLVKILTGAIPADDGEVFLQGVRAEFRSTTDALDAGIVPIYQELALVHSLSVRANMFLGRERMRGPFIDSDFERQTATRVLRSLGVTVPLKSRLGELSPAYQQLIEIGRALIRDAKILIMDEPTASLSPREVDYLFPILQDLATRGIAILFISHRLDEVLAIASKVTVMRDGETLETLNAGQVTRSYLVEQMVGHRLEAVAPRRKVQRADVLLEVRGLSGAGVHDLSFVASRGEVLGFAGLVGAGRTEMARLLFGAERLVQGEILLNGVSCRSDSPHDAIRHGLCLLTEDRKNQGLVLLASSKHNFAIPNLLSWSRAGWIDRKRELSRFNERASEVRLSYGGPDQPVAQLSGGNQQKLLIARWLEKDCEVIIFDEPTRGIDVGAKAEISNLLRRLAGEGKVIIVISSDFSELLDLCDRILVMKRGRITGEIEDVAAATQDTIMALAV